MITLESENYNHKEITKALILKAINDNPNKGVYEIAKMLGMGKSSLYRHIYKLNIPIPKQHAGKVKYQNNTGNPQ